LLSVFLMNKDVYKTYDLDQQKTRV